MMRVSFCCLFDACSLAAAKPVDQPSAEAAEDKPTVVASVGAETGDDADPEAAVSVAGERKTDAAMDTDLVVEQVAEAGVVDEPAPDSVIEEGPAATEIEEDIPSATSEVGCKAVAIHITI